MTLGSTARGFGQAESNYTAIPNTVIRDKRLTGNAFQLWAWLASHRDGFQVSFATIERALGLSRTAIRSAVGVLIEHGYLHIRDEDGRRVYVTLLPASVGADYADDGGLFDPPDLQLVGTNHPPDRGRNVPPGGDETSPHKKNNLEDQEKTSADAPRGAAAEAALPAMTHEQTEVMNHRYPPAFEDLWKRYPQAGRRGKGAAAVAWVKAVHGWRTQRAFKDPAITQDRLAAAIDAFTASRPDFVPHLATWLNQQRYDDDYTPAQGGYVHRPGQNPFADPHLMDGYTERTAP